MSGQAMSDSDWERQQFDLALQRLPSPMPVFSDGAVCPWCGWGHETVTFGMNDCAGCNRRFAFGYPEWGEIIPGRPESWVPFPWREWDAVGHDAKHFPPFEPTEELIRLRKLANEMVESHKRSIAEPPSRDGRTLN